MNNILYNDKNKMVNSVFKGSLEFANAGELKNILLDMVNMKPEKIALNFNDVEFMDSSALAVLIQVFKDYKIDRSNIIIYGANAVIQNIFQLSRLDRFFYLIPNEKFEEIYGEIEFKET